MSPVACALTRLLDDASQFPPGNLPLEEAWDAHRRWRESERSAIVGRFLVPSTRVAALAELAGDAGVDVGIVVAPGTDAASIGVLNGGRPVTSIELRGPADDVARWRSLAPDALIVLEGVAVESVAALRAGDRYLGAKLRCGGLEASAFPSAETVARFVTGCVQLDVPFKATAGLHGALRNWDAEIGVFHHGFLNLWAATALASRGADERELVHCLGIEDGREWWDLGVSIEMLEQARRWFVAFGTCSIEEPLDGLLAVGLLDA